VVELVACLLKDIEGVKSVRISFSGRIFGFGEVMKENGFFALDEEQDKEGRLWKGTWQKLVDGKCITIRLNKYVSPNVIEVVLEGPEKCSTKYLLKILRR